MLTKPIAIVGLAAAVIVAAGAGAYLGVRQNAVQPQTLVAEATDATDVPRPSDEAGLADAGAETGTAVAATEAVVERAPAPASDDVVPTPSDAGLEAVPAAAEPTPRSEPAPPVEARGVTVPVAPEPVSPVAEANTPPVTPPAATVPPADPDPVETARADLPAIEGWTRTDPVAPSPVPNPEPASRDPESVTFNGGTPEPTALSFVELEIAADSVIGLQVETAVSTRTAEIEDLIEARVTRNVLVADQVAVPAGTKMRGSVVLVEKVGKLRGAARLGVRFHTLVMDDGLQVPVTTETIYREGKATGSDSVSKIGGAAVGGAILGAIFGGSRGAAIGGSIGAAGGTAAALNTDGDPAGLPPGTMLTVRLSRPVAVTVEQ